jgi:hypothetical protein
MEEKYFNLVLNHFGITKETYDDWKHRCNVGTTNDGFLFFEKHPNTDFGYRIGLSLHHSIVDAFRKYADNNALSKYMEGEGHKFEPNSSLSAITANIFYVCENKDKEKLIKSIKKLHRSRFDMFEFEDMDNGYFIAYD